MKNGRFWYLNEIRRAGHGAFPSCAERHLAWMGRGIVVHGGDVDDKPGRIAGLSSEGGLRVRFPDGERVILFRQYCAGFVTVCFIPSATRTDNPGAERLAGQP